MILISRVMPGTTVEWIYFKSFLSALSKSEITTISEAAIVSMQNLYDICCSEKGFDMNVDIFQSASALPFTKPSGTYGAQKKTTIWIKEILNSNHNRNRSFSVSLSLSLCLSHFLCVSVTFSFSLSNKLFYEFEFIPFIRYFEALLNLSRYQRPKQRRRAQICQKTNSKVSRNRRNGNLSDPFSFKTLRT